MLTDQEQSDLIATLRVASEDMNIIVGMYNNMGRYKDNILEAKEKLDEALFKLTGDKFYNQDKPLGGSKNG